MEIRIFELPDNFIGQGEAKNSTFRLIEKTKDYYIYERRETFEHYNRVAVSYEVFKRMVYPLKKLQLASPKYAGFTHFVRYPSSSEFGVWAFYCKSLERAKDFASAITDGVEKTA